MRTTVDLPDALFHKTKAEAARRGSTLKALVVQGIEKEVSGGNAQTGRRVSLPMVRMPKGRKLDLSGVDFDDLLT